MSATAPASASAVPSVDEFRWGTDRFEVSFLATTESPVSIHSIEPVIDIERHPSEAVLSVVLRQLERPQPIVELRTTGAGRARSGERLVESSLGHALRYVSHRVEDVDGWSVLRIEQTHADSALVVHSVFRSRRGLTGFQTWNVVTNCATTPIVLTSVSSFAFAPDATDGLLTPDTSDLLWARSEWIAENRWERAPLRAGLLPDLGLALHGQDPRAAVRRSSTGSWSTGRYLPVGVLTDNRSRYSLGWQVENNGGWSWEVGEKRGGLYLALSGPDDEQHQWRRTLVSGGRFESVRAGVVVSDKGADGAFAELTRYRRAIRRPNTADAGSPVIYNDYMNTLDGKPTTAALLPLIDAAADVGADYFVIDAGWYDDDEDWWDAVGDWRPAVQRFAPIGLGGVIEHIRSRGLRPGIWLEPEMIGVRSGRATSLPEAAFLHRDGKRTVEHGRLHLDLRHPAARAVIDEAIDRLIGEFGIAYFKLDYNISSGPGTDLGEVSPGDGLLEAGRAHLALIDGILERHPGLILENCSSGAMRADGASLAHFQLQSTSDQQNAELYPPIAASAPASIAPEQAASWAYPQPGMSAEQIAFTMITGLSSRLYLSGFLDSMTVEERRLVTEGVAVAKHLAPFVRRSVPSWPLGLPGWTDRDVAVVLADAEQTVLSVWRREHSTEPITLSLPHLRGREFVPTTLYPTTLTHWAATWTPRTATLTLFPGKGIGARQLLLRPTD